VLDRYHLQVDVVAMNVQEPLYDHEKNIDKEDLHLKKLSEQAKVSKAKKWKQIEEVWKRRAIIRVCRG
jgi:hypothetical protein